MAKHIQIIIPEPCHENWAEMSPVEKGRFCNSCKKQVTDFSGMNDEQLVAFFKKSPGDVCGRFRKEQLENELAIPQKRIPWFRYFLQAALPAVLVSHKGHAQGKVALRPRSPLLEQQANDLKEMEKNIQSHKQRVIIGQVLDENGTAISYANIWRHNSLQGSVTDKEGRFRLTLSEEDSVVTLEVSHIGYTTKTVMIGLSKEGSLSPIYLQRVEVGEMMTLGFVVVKHKKKLAPMAFPKTNDPSPLNFKVFPNPLTAGGSLNIELMNKLKEGYYYLQIIGLDGKRIYQKEIWIDAQARVMNIEMPVIASGEYIMSLKERKTGKEIGEKILVN